MTRPLLVMKFGGTSLGSPERIEQAADLVAAAACDHTVTVVVSAMAKVTDSLLDTMRYAESRDEPAVERHVRELQERHADACRTLPASPERDTTMRRADELIDGFERVARGMLMLGERPPRSVDEAVSTGEKLSALLLGAPTGVRGCGGRSGQRRRDDRD